MAVDRKLSSTGSKPAISRMHKNTPRRGRCSKRPTVFLFQEASASGIEGKTRRPSRPHPKFYLGICLGLQIATIEFCRHVLGMTGANSTEFEDNPNTLQLFSCLKFPKLISEARCGWEGPTSSSLTAPRFGHCTAKVTPLTSDTVIGMRSTRI